MRTVPSFYLQRHSRDVLNQALPPIFMRTVRRSFNKLCARREEAGNEATVALLNTNKHVLTGKIPTVGLQIANSKSKATAVFAGTAHNKSSYA